MEAFEIQLVRYDYYFHCLGEGKSFKKDFLSSNWKKTFYFLSCHLRKRHVWVRKQYQGQHNNEGKHRIRSSSSSEFNYDFGMIVEC
jgi:hypothetical protein